jgi:hypothetical protein
MTEEQTKESNPVESFAEKEYRNIRIFSMHKDVVTEFVEWCKKYAGGKYSAGIQLLLSKAKSFDLIAGLDLRLKSLEHEIALLKQSKVVEEQSKQEPKVKTIGGK